MLGMIVYQPGKKKKKDILKKLAETWKLQEKNLELCQKLTNCWNITNASNCKRLIIKLKQDKIIFVNS